MSNSKTETEIRTGGAGSLGEIAAGGPAGKAEQNQAEQNTGAKHEDTEVDQAAAERSPVPNSGPAIAGS